MATYNGTNTFQRARQAQLFQKSPEQQRYAYNAYLQAFNHAGRVITPYGTGSTDPYEIEPGYGDKQTYERARIAFLGEDAVRGPVQFGRTGGGSTSVAIKAGNKIINPSIRGINVRPGGSVVRTRGHVLDVISGLQNRNALGAAQSDLRNRQVESQIASRESAIDLRNRAATVAEERLASQKGVWATKEAEVAERSENRNHIRKAIAELNDKYLNDPELSADPDAAAKFNKALAAVQRGSNPDAAIRMIKSEALAARNVNAQQQKQHDSIRLQNQQFQQRLTSIRGVQQQQSAARQWAQTLALRIQAMERYQPRQGDAAISPALLAQQMGELQQMKDEAESVANGGQQAQSQGRGQLTDPSIWQQYLGEANGDPEEAERLARLGGWE